MTTTDLGVAPRRLDSLTSLRWVAASTVFLMHANEFVVRQDAALGSTDPATAEGHTWFERVAAQGNVGVSFFFILSGFVLTWSYRPDVSRLDFYRRRFARVYPAYFVMAVVAVPLLVAIGRIEGMTQVVKGFLPITLLQAWIPIAGATFAGNGVSWSLSCEAFFYLTFPFLIGPILRAERRVQLGLGAICVVTPLALALVFRPPDQDGMLFLVLYANPVIRSFEFVLGIVIGALVRSGVRVPWLRLGPTLAVCAVVYAAVGWVPVYLQYGSLTILPFAALVLAAAQADLDGTSPRALHARWFVTLGQWSYAFYLVHQLVLSVVRRLEPRGAVAVLSIVAAYVVATALSAALYRFVEHPMERRLRPAPRTVEASFAR